MSRTFERPPAAPATTFLPGGGPIVPLGDAEASVKMAAKFRDDLKPTTAVGQVLVEILGRMAVRLDRCAMHEIAQLKARAEAGEDMNAPDMSPEGLFAWKYEQSARTGFYRALRELEKAKAEADAGARKDDATLCKEATFRELASSLRVLKRAEGPPSKPAQAAPPRPALPPLPTPAPELSPLDELARVPRRPPLPTNCVAFSIGKRR